MMQAKKLHAELNEEALIATKIPYSLLLNAETVETKSGHLLQVIKIQGLHADTLDDELIDHEKHNLNHLWMSMVDSSTSLYFHTIRKKVKRALNAVYDTEFMQTLHDGYQAHLQSKSFYINEHYLTVVKKPPVGGIRGLRDVWQALSNKVDHAARDVYRQKMIKDLNKITSRILHILSGYGARILSISEKNETSPLSFLSEIINLAEREVKPPQSDLAKYLPYKRMFFDVSTGTLAIRDINNTPTFAAILSIKEYVAATYANCLDSLLNIDAEFIITQSFSFLDKGNARKKIQDLARDQAQSDDGQTSENEKIYAALDALGSANAVTGEHHLSILIRNNDLQFLEEDISKIDSALNHLGLIAIREDKGLKAAYFANLPANHPYIVRRAIISSLNLASFANFHNSYMGKLNGNHWGEAVTVLEAINGAPFYFNFHVMDVGNSILIGPQGRGKTALEAFLVAQSMKYGGRAIFFDKDQGLEIFVRANGGKYSTITPGSPSGFAPFQLADSPENRSFIIQLLRMIATNKGQSISDEEDILLKQMVDIAYQLPKEKRIFRNVVSALGIRKAGSLRMRFDAWIGEGEHAWIFDNDQDYLEIENNIIGFDVTSILENPFISIPIYFYMFHRIEQTLDGTKTRIVVAEGWRALQNEIFMEKVRDWSSTPRKKNTLLILDTQSTTDISASPIGCKIIQESVTQIYFANKTAEYAEYVEKFGLTEKEFEIIRSLHEQDHYFLLKQGHTSIVVKADLSFNENIMAVLSGRKNYSKLLHQLIQQHGDDPKNWLPIYYAQVKDLMAANKVQQKQ